MSLSLYSPPAVFLLGAFSSVPDLVERERPIDSKVSVDESAALMTRVASGEEAALSILLDRWQIPLFRFFHRSLRSHADSEELTQLVFIKLHGSAHRYKPTAKFSTYLFTIARNLLLDEIKRRNRRPVDTVDPAELNMATPARDPRDEIEEALEVCLDRLPETHRTALLLRVQRELSYKEIANIMKASESVVKTWIHRARQQARKSLDDLRDMSS
jgi:RNA polymerase sigma-70 factor (ECF subfamily)